MTSFRRATTAAPIFRLPLELRQQIYAYFLPRENISHPLPSVGITSVSHRPPTSTLLNIHPQIADEILDYFYAISTWKLIFSHAFNFFRVDPDLKRLEQSPALRRIRKVEVVFYCDVLLLREYPSFGLDAFCREIHKRAGRACDVLREASKLHCVTVSWIDTTGTGGWTQKSEILAPLRKLSPQCSFRIGEVNGPEDVDYESFLKAVREVLGKGSKLEMDSECPEHESPAKLRMLAFDIRQDRHLCKEQRGWGTGLIRRDSKTE